MSAVSDIADVLEDLRRLSDGDPAALAERERILATKQALIRHLQRDDPRPAATSLTCARPDCANPVIRRPGQTGRPAIYCSPACRPSRRSTANRGQISVEIDQDDAAAAGLDPGRSWIVRLRRGRRTVIVGRGFALECPVAPKLEWLHQNKLLTNCRAYSETYGPPPCSPRRVGWNSMDNEEALSEVDRLLAELLMRRESVEKASREVAGLEKIIGGYMEMFPELENDRGALVAEVLSGGDNTPRGAEAVRKILQENPEERFYVSQLVERMKVRGWLPESENPANAIRTALERLINSPDSDVYKLRVGNQVAYVYDPDRAPPEPYDEEPF